MFTTTVAKQVLDMGIKVPRHLSDHIGHFFSGWIHTDYMGDLGSEMTELMSCRIIELRGTGSLGYNQYTGPGICPAEADALIQVAAREAVI